MWLPMESLCRQETKYPWELIIFEEKHDEQCGKDYFTPYFERLCAAGCVSFRYLTSEEKLPLSKKWVRLSQQAHEDSVMFCICAADNYYQKDMVEDTGKAYDDGYDWLVTKKGFFYNFQTKQLVLYDKPQSAVGLQMSGATKLMQTLPNESKFRLLDSWIYAKTAPKKPLSGVNTMTLCTHGYHNISQARGEMINKSVYPFYETDKKLEDIVPADIAQKIRNDNYTILP